MLTKNLASSDLIKQKQAKTIYLNYISQEQSANQGCSQRVKIQSGSGADNSSSQLLNLAEGALFTTVTEQQTQLSNTACPVTTATAEPEPEPAPAPAPPPTLKLLVLGDTGASTTATAISTRLTALGYTGFTVNSQTIGTSYTGSTDLANITTYNTVLLYTNSGQTGAAGLSTNIKNWVALGGHLVSATFIWNLAPSGFDYTITPLQARSQSNDSTGNLTVTVVHPITTGVNTSITNGQTTLNNGNASLQTGATTIATFTSSGVPYVVIKTSGASRLVAINAYINGLNVYTNFRNLVTNACLWAVGILN
jgi:hypothetical protein